MTKTRNNTNRSRKAKATVRKTKARRPDAVTADINACRVKKALNSKTFTQEPKYYISIVFNLNASQDISDPIDWLEDRMGEGTIDRLNTGSGYCLMSGHRDFGFEGTKAEMIAILKQFARSPFRIHTIHSNIVEMY